MAQMDLGILSEDCIALSDALARKCDEDGQPVLALTLRQIALRYRLLLNKLYGIKTIPDVSPQLEAQIVISSTAPIAELIAAVEAEAEQRADDAETERDEAIARAEAAEARAAELEAALAAERAAHAWRPFHVNGDHPIGVPIEAIVVVEDDNDNLTWGFDVRFWRPAAPQEPAR